VGDVAHDDSGGDYIGSAEEVRIKQLKNLQTQSMTLLPDLFPKPVKERRFSFGKGNGVWNVNGEIFDPNKTIAFPKAGTAEHWTFKSGGGWIHPIHHHHTEGLVLSRDGKAPQPDERARKDAYRIGDNALENGGSSSMTVEIKFRDWLGKYPVHCHNPMHEDAGMMFNFEIVDAKDPRAGK
jgi:FtsP/CotA-like multicopper oxidase with cupredoxin domain